MGDLLDPDQYADRSGSSKKANMKSVPAKE